MNAGLSNLDTLKKTLLSASQAGDTDNNAQIQLLGRAMAALFDRYLNRTVQYSQNQTQIVQADRSHWYLPSFPILVIQKVELRYFLADTWQDISGQPLAMNAETGLLHFGYTLGITPLQFRVTWSGGYWFQTLEPTDPGYLICATKDDPGYPNALPAELQAASPAANPPTLESYKFLLPQEIQGAWLLQCQEVWSQRDKLGLSIIDKPGQQAALGSIGLSPLVKEMLRPHIRYQLT